jgi:hypothetical protein
MTEQNINPIAPVSLPGENESAATRKAAFPFRFPRDTRRLGGKFTVDENAAILQRLFYFERRLSQALGAWTLALPEIEVKIETGRHIFWHMDAARRIRERMTEQEGLLKKVDSYRDAGIDTFIDEMLSAADAAEFIAGAHLVLGKALETAYRQHMDDTCAIADAPTIRIFKQILVDYEPMLAWAEACLAAYVAGGVDESPVTRWRWHLSCLLSSVGGVTGQDRKGPAPAGLRIDKKPFQRVTAPVRDTRFVAFSNTGEYHEADGGRRFPHDSYEARRMDFVRTQRDEMDAIESFGTFLWDARFKDFQTEYDLARITWDESRHTEIGHNTLQIMGYDPFALPNRLTGSACRGKIEVPYAFTQINMFGEVAVLKTIDGLVDEARDRKDMVLAHISDFVRADELTHVRKGQTIIKHLTDLDWKNLEYKTRELFTECLIGLGAIKPNGDSGVTLLTREEMERLIGE